jgi:hypothetical protein
MRHRMIITTISVVFFSYAAVTQTFLSFFNCPLVRMQELGSGSILHLCGPAPTRGRHFSYSYI